MNYLLIENQKGIKTSLYEKLCKNYPNQARLEILNTSTPLPLAKPINGKFIIKVVLQNKKYQELINYTLRIKDLANIVYICNPFDTEVTEFLVNKCPKIKIIKNNPTEEDYKTYIKENIPGIAKTGIDLIIAQLGKREMMLIRFIEQLKICNKKITVNFIKEELIDFQKPTFIEIYWYILLKKGKEERVSEVLYRYRFSFRPLKDFLLKELKIDIQIFKALLEKSMNITNYRSFAFNNKIPPYKVKRGIELYKEVTYESLILLKLKVENINSVTELYEVVFGRF